MLLLRRPLSHKHLSCIPGSVEKEPSVTHFKITAYDHLIAEILTAISSVPFPHLLDGGLVDIHAHHTENVGGRIGPLQSAESHFSPLRRRSNFRSSGRGSPGKVVGIVDLGYIPSFSRFGSDQDYPPCSP